jgi:hypothetical protein
MTGRIKKARKQQELDALAFNVLVSFRHQGAMQWTDWHETTSARRGGRRLGTRTFSDAVKRLVASGRVRKDKDGCYEAVYSAVEDSEIEAGGDVGNFITVANSLDDETDQCLKALLKAGNGNADIADIALQQLTDTEA